LKLSETVYFCTITGNAHTSIKMKKSIVLAAAVLAMAACKKSEEVKVDETKMETPGDTITGKDTIATTVNEVSPAESGQAQPETKSEDVIAATAPAVSYATFGDKIAADKALNPAQMLKKYKSLKAGDTLNVKFASKVHEVCKKKGCWMSMELPDGKESFVKFKDYAFFVPKNADNSEAIVSGKAFVDVVSVAELQHYAKDGGKSQEEIEKITEPKITYAFMADGVLIKE
jgi:hypothetical protein